MKRLLLICLFSMAIHSFAQTGTDIILFDLKKEDNQWVLSNGRNITKHKGYDNQPFFHPLQPLIYFTSSDDTARIDSSEIKTYHYGTHQTAVFTKTRDREYSPTVTPDAQFISCILQRKNGDQDLVKYPIAGGRPEVLINHLKVGYHAWAGDDRLFLFVLEDSAHFSLHHYYLGKNADTVVAENIGRSLHRIPGQNAMCFVQRITDKLSVIKRYDLATGLISNIVYTIPGQDHLTWLQDGTILMSDGKKIFYHQYTSSQELKDKQWTPLVVKGDSSFLKNITRLAVSSDNTKLAMVVGE